MRHHDGGAPRHQLGERVLYQVLAFGVERARGLVQHQDGAVCQHGARDGDALALAAGKLDAAFARDGVEALRQLLDELQGVCLARRLADLLHGGVGPAVGDVLGDGAMEQQRLLRHVGDTAAQALLGDLGHVLPVDQDPAFLDVTQAQQQLGERGLTGSAHAHKPDALACGDVQLEVVEDLGAHAAVGIPEVDSLEVDGSLAHHQGFGVGRVGYQARLVEHARHAACVAEGAVEALQAVVDEVELVGDGVGVGEHHHQGARRDAEPGIAARNEHGNHAHDHHGDARGDDAARDGRAHALAIAGDHFAVGLVEESALVVLAAVGLHRQDVGHRIGKLARKVVLGARRLLVQVQDALVHDVGGGGVDDQQHCEHGNVGGHARGQDDEDGYHRNADGKEGEGERFHHQVVGARELRGLRYQGSAVAVRMEAHGLVGKRIEGGGGKVVVHGDLQLVLEVVLQLAAGLPHHVDGDQQGDIGPEDGKDLVGRDGRGADPVHDQAHHEGAAVGEQSAEEHGGNHQGHEQAQVPLGGGPEIMQGPPGGGLLLRVIHALSPLLLRAACPE